MKIGALIVGVFGFIFASFTALYVGTGLTGPNLLSHLVSGSSVFYLGTIVVAAVGLLGAILIFWAPMAGAWVAGIATVAGAFTSGTLWLGAGSFFFVVAALAYSVSRQKDDRVGGD